MTYHNIQNQPRTYKFLFLQIVFYKPDELTGKVIIIVDNLKPAKLMGVESQGMLLAAKKNNKLKIITVDGEIETGAEVS